MDDEGEFARDRDADAEADEPCLRDCKTDSTVDGVEAGAVTVPALPAGGDAAAARDDDDGDNMENIDDVVADGDNKEEADNDDDAAEVQGGGGVLVCEPGNDEMVGSADGGRERLDVGSDNDPLDARLEFVMALAAAAAKESNEDVNDRDAKSAVDDLAVYRIELVMIGGGAGDTCEAESDPTAEAAD